MSKIFLAVLKSGIKLKINCQRTKIITNKIICKKLITTEIKCEYLNFMSCFSSLYLFIKGINIKLDKANNRVTTNIK